MNESLVTSSQPNIDCGSKEQPYSKKLAREDAGDACAIANKNSYITFIYCLYILLAISTIISVSAIYISKSSKVIIPVNEATPSSESVRNGTRTNLGCLLLGPLSKDWYYQSQYNPGYACEPFKTVSNINIQPLQVREHECNDTDHCYDLIRTYLGIMEGHSKFGFFIDNDANVYGGRGWFCEFFKGQIWVAVMVEGFGAAPESEKDRVLSHFKKGVIPQERNCSLSLSELHFDYFDEIVI